MRSYVDREIDLALQRHEEAWFIFNRFDVDDSGTIDEAELEEAEDDIKLLREELTAAEEDRREMNAHIDKVENQLRAELNKAANDLTHSQESETALRLEMQKLRAENDAKALATKKAHYEEKEVLGDEIEALQRQINQLLKQAKEDKKKAEQAAQAAKKDAESSAFEISGLKAKLESEKKRSEEHTSELQSP